MLAVNLSHILLLAPLLTLLHAAPTFTPRQATIPQYALDYAPILYLDSAEQYMPADIVTFLDHITPDANYTPITTAPSPVTLNNLASFNTFADNGSSVYLTSNSGIESLPPWFNGVVPTADGQTPNAISAVIITVAKADNILDVFYFYFYAYNEGDHVLNQAFLEFGDHVGDWEHNMVRFVAGVPQAIWFSQHDEGEAFTYDAVQKSGLRPVGYVAKGTHAVYGTSGAHDHTIPDVNLPVGPLEDDTDAGYLWDPALSAQNFLFSYNEGDGTYAAYEAGTPTDWLSFVGRWGDEQLPASAAGQVDFFGLVYKYVSGPTGPYDKRLNRTDVCPESSGCVVRPVLTV